MNREQIEGAADKAVGKLKEEWGKMTDSPDAEVKGRIDQVKGEIRQERGRIKEDRQKKQG